MEKNEKKYKKVLELVSTLKKCIQRAIKQGDFESAFGLISTAAKVLYEVNIYYTDFELEEQLGVLSGKLLEKNDLYSPNYNKIIFYDGLGLKHRGLALIYVKALCKIKDVVYVTYEDRKSSIGDILKLLGEHNSKVYFIKRKPGKYIDRIIQLKTVIETEKPSDFIFYGHPDDVVATTLVKSYNSLMTSYMINLTDHAFWLGAGCIDYFIEFRDYGASISKKYRNIDASRLMELPFYPCIDEDVNFQGYPFEMRDKYDFFFSGGSLYKTLGDNNKYYYIVSQILERHSDLIFWYAGVGNDSELRKLKKRYPLRVYHTEERADLFQILKRCVFYLSTYPISGGLMCQYAAKAGKVPLTLYFDEDIQGYLINQESLGIEFKNTDELYQEADRLIDDKKYAKLRESQMLTANISEACFDKQLRNILENKKTDFDICYLDIDTGKFRETYLDRLDMMDIRALAINKENYLSSFKYTPCLAFCALLIKIWKKYISRMFILFKRNT